jgi:hypothetical protein
MRFPMLALALAVALPACDSLDTFDVETSGTTTIAGSPLGVSPLFPELELPGLTDFRFTESKAWKDNDLSADDVESVKLRSVKLNVLSPERGSLDFMDEITIAIEAPGLERKTIARKSVPDGVAEVSLDVPDVELKRYATSNEMEIVTTVTGKQPQETTTLRARAVFEVNAAIF